VRAATHCAVRFSGYRRHPEPFCQHCRERIRRRAAPSQTSELAGIKKCEDRARSQSTVCNHPSRGFPPTASIRRATATHFGNRCV